MLKTIEEAIKTKNMPLNDINSLLDNLLQQMKNESVELNDNICKEIAPIDAAEEELQIRLEIIARELSIFKSFLRGDDFLFASFEERITCKDLTHRVKLTDLKKLSEKSYCSVPIPIIFLDGDKKVGIYDESTCEQWKIEQLGVLNEFENIIFPNSSSSPCLGKEIMGKEVLHKVYEKITLKASKEHHIIWKWPLDEERTRKNLKKFYQKILLDVCGDLIEGHEVRLKSRDRYFDTDSQQFIYLDKNSREELLNKFIQKVDKEVKTKEWIIKSLDNDNLSIEELTNNSKIKRNCSNECLEKLINDKTKLASKYNEISNQYDNNFKKITNIKNYNKQYHILVNIKEEDNPLIYYCKNEDLENIKKIIEKNNLKPQEQSELINKLDPKYKLNAFHAAAITGNAKIIEYLLSKGADTELPDNEVNGYYPIHHLVESGSVEALDVLQKQREIKLGNKATVDSVAKKCGRTPLFSAAFFNDVNVAEWLIKHGANINFMTQLGTPLHSAAMKGNVNVLELLLQKNNIQVFSENELRESSLFVAAYYEQKECLKCFMKYGYCLRAQDIEKLLMLREKYDIKSKLQVITEVTQTFIKPIFNLLQPNLNNLSNINKEFDNINKNDFDEKIEEIEKIEKVEKNIKNEKIKITEKNENKQNNTIPGNQSFFRNSNSETQKENNTETDKNNK